MLLSDVVTFAVEYRLFILDGRVTTGSRYARYGRLDPAPLPGDLHEQAVRSFAEALLLAHRDTLPSAVVVDVGLTQDPDTGTERWAAVEANMPWFAHTYAADPDRALDVVLRAAGPRAHVTPADRRFVRALERSAA
ncbi:ATP-grasp domain-containing protein [Kitasatospora sp. McL0602]|uniref:ATP-grasp domain-containing protein n=1 Tax=Kitasatospora sp. McL0602 TaxID=3439530 RepID=UPI003F89EC65